MMRLSDLYWRVDDAVVKLAEKTAVVLWVIFCVALFLVGCVLILVFPPLGTVVAVIGAVMMLGPLGEAFEESVARGVRRGRYDA